VVEELTPAQLSLGEIQRVLQVLLEEHVSVRDLVRIFEALSVRARVGKDVDGLVESVRQMLGPAVVAPYAVGGSLPVLSFEPALEQRLLEGLRGGEDGAFLALDVDLAQDVLTSLAALTRDAEEQNLSPVLACAPQLRPAVRRMTNPSLPRLPVVSYTELGGPVQISSVGVVTSQPAAVGGAPA
jgi:flagellar biosynthesis protein FlhA